MATAPREQAVRAALRAREWARRRVDGAHRPERGDGGDSRGDSSTLPQAQDRLGRREEPRLRLVRPAEDAKIPLGGGAITPIGGVDDPRWVLAVRTAEELQGAILPPDRRERLIRLGKAMGLSAFDSNLIIAILQDQARRGRLPEQCPAAAEGQLAMVPLPEPAPWWDSVRMPRMQVALLVAAAVTIELLLVLWVF